MATNTDPLKEAQNLLNQGKSIEAAVYLSQNTNMDIGRAINAVNDMASGKTPTDIPTTTPYTPSTAYNATAAQQAQAKSNLAGIDTAKSLLAKGDAAGAAAAVTGINGLTAGQAAVNVADILKGKGSFDIGKPDDKPPASDGSTTKLSFQPVRSVNPMPTYNPFVYNPSRSIDPNQANLTAGQRAWMQVQPQVQAQQQQRDLVLEGLDQLRQKLRQGLDYATTNTVKQVSPMVDQQRRLRAAQGLSESGYVMGDQQAIQKDAMDTIAQASREEALQEQQAAEQTNTTVQGINAELARLQGLVSTKNGKFVGTLVDSLQQEILDKNAAFQLQERQVLFAENQAQNDYNLNKWKAQEAIRQGDEQLAFQYEQLAQQKDLDLQRIQAEKDRLAEEKRQWDAGAAGRQAEIDRITQQIEESKQLLPGKVTEQDTNNKLLSLNVQKAELEKKALDAQDKLLNDPDLGVRARAQVEMDQARADLNRINAEISRLNAEAAKTSTSSPAKMDAQTMSSLANNGVRSIGVTTSPQGFLSWVNQATGMANSGTSWQSMLNDFGEIQDELAKDGVDPQAFRDWLYTMRDFYEAHRGIAR